MRGTRAKQIRRWYRMESAGWDPKLPPQYTVRLFKRLWMQLKSMYAVLEAVR